MFIEIEGTLIYLQEQGKGRPALFLHGNPDSADVWQPLIERLSPQMRCIAVDLPGFGRSKLPEHYPQTLGQLSAWVDGLLHALRIREPIHLIVHDLGAAFGLAWAAENPSKIHKLVISNAAFSTEYRWHRLARLFRTPLVGDMLLALTTPALLGRELRRASPRLPADHLERTAKLYTMEARQAALYLYRSADPKKLAGWEQQLLKGIAERPACVLWGDQDPYIPSTFADRYGAAKVHHLPECGHWPFVEDPDQSARILLAFLADSLEI
jgi:pimeloyl-ACP methyl ester carboxylesterase